VRKTLTDHAVERLKPRASRYAVPDPALAGHYVRVTPNGTKSYCAVTRNRLGKQVWSTIGAADVLTIEEAREKAREIIKRVRAGLPVETKPNTFKSVAALFLAKHVQAQGLRSEHEITRLLKAHVHPRWDDRDFLDIRRSDVVTLLDEVERDHGARQSDYVLAIIRKMMNWHATRDDAYTPPLVQGMGRTRPAKERARKRVLTDSELRAVWKAAEGNGSYGRLVRLALLTAQRRDKLVSMRWADIKGNTWTIATAAREKGNAVELVLPPIAVKVIEAQPHIGDNPYVFAAARGNEHLRGFSKLKKAFDAKLTDVAPWCVHDLRRTARSLMGRAGVSSDHAERVMGHAIDGVEGVYDRHQYSDEKRDALAKLAKQIAVIVNRRVKRTKH
jgi:integrase